GGNIMQPFITRAHETLYKLSRSEMMQELDDVSNRQSQATNRGPRRRSKIWADLATGYKWRRKPASGYFNKKIECEPEHLVEEFDAKQDIGEKHRVLLLFSIFSVLECTVTEKNAPYIYLALHLLHFSGRLLEYEGNDKDGLDMMTETDINIVIMFGGCCVYCVLCVMTVKNFDPARYAGRWFGVQGQEDCHCTQ
ncbi:chloroplast lipocalin, partial [Striga asiatica]